MDSIGNLVMALVERRGTVSSTLRATRPVSGPPTTMDECRALREWAEALPSEPLVPATAEQIGKHLTFLAATLPTQGHDQDAGERRFAVYVSLLGGWSNEAIAFMCREACRRLRWFPVPAQMLEILNEYRRPISEQEHTLRICSQFAHDALEGWLVNLREGQPVGDVPDSWLRIAVERGVMRKLDDGSYVSRARFVGPTLAAKFTGLCPTHL